MAQLMYSIESQTRIVDAVNHDNNRTEFRFEPQCVLGGNVRLCGLGVRATAANIKYDPKAGVFQLIQNIYLMDGGVVLDQLQNVNEWMSFKNNLNTNDENKSMANLKKLGVGYKLKEDNKGVEIMNSYTNTDANSIANADSATNTTWVSLQELLPILASTSYLSTNVFKDLRLVIEYVQTGKPGSTSDIFKPTLVYDKVMNDKVASDAEKSLKSAKLIYSNIESDTYYLSAVAAGGATQSVNIRTKGFDGKTLNKLLLSKKSAATLGSDNTRSKLAEKINFVVNGRQLLPYEGISENNFKLKLLNDSWGEVNSVYGQNDAYAIPDGLDLNNTHDNKDFIGVVVSEKIEDLQITYQATPTAGTALPANTLYMFGEITKALIMNDNGTYKIMYL